MPDVILYQDQPVTRSLDVARRFHKRHDHVLRLIDNIFASVGLTAQNWAVNPAAIENRVAAQNWAATQVATESRVAPQFWGATQEELAEFFQSNFLPGEYVYEPGEKAKARRVAPMYYLTRDGFSYLVMGFTGKEAALWKVRFIKLFNLMEAELREQARMPERRAFLAGKLYAHALRWTPERRKLVGRVLLFREAGQPISALPKTPAYRPRRLAISSGATFMRTPLLIGTRWSAWRSGKWSEEGADRKRGKFAGRCCHEQ